CLAARLSRPAPLVEHHEQRREALGVDQAEDLDVTARLLAPAGDLERTLRLGEQAVVAQGLVAPRGRGVAVLLVPLLLDLAEVGIARMALLVLEDLQLALAQPQWAPSDTAPRPAHQVKIAQHAGKLVHGQRP